MQEQEPERNMIPLILLVNYGVSEEYMALVAQNLIQKLGGVCHDVCLELDDSESIINAWRVARTASDIVVMYIPGPSLVPAFKLLAKSEEVDTYYGTCILQTGQTTEFLRNTNGQAFLNFVTAFHNPNVCADEILHDYNKTFTPEPCAV